MKITFSELLPCCFVFFFSSRRRHTRCGRDWSSDVCSSDLPCACSSPPSRFSIGSPKWRAKKRRRIAIGPGAGEGRGGEEGRNRWAPYHLKKKKKKEEERVLVSKKTKTGGNSIQDSVSN